MPANADHSSPDLESIRAAYRDRWEAIETAKARELADLSDQRAYEIILALEAVEGWRERSDWSGLVEQQALLHRARSK